MSQSPFVQASMMIKSSPQHPRKSPGMAVRVYNASAGVRGGGAIQAGWLQVQEENRV